MDLQCKGEQIMINLTTLLIQPFHILTITLLSLLLPLSFLLLSRLSCANYLLSLSFIGLNVPNLLPYFPSTTSTTSISTSFSVVLYTIPSLLYLLVSIVTIATFIHSLTGKITIITHYPVSDPIFRPRLYTAWIFLCTLQVCVGLGIEGSIAAGVDGSIFGVDDRLCFLSRAIFFLGLHETMLHWCRVVVKPVVDDTVFGASREEKWVEKVAIAASFGCLWWWRLRDEVESLVVVTKAKRELSMGIGMADFAGWCLYYLTVTIGIVRVVKGLMWIFMLLLCRRRSSIGTSSSADHDQNLDNKV